MATNQRLARREAMDKVLELLEQAQELMTYEYEYSYDFDDEMQYLANAIDEAVEVAKEIKTV